MRHQDRLAYIIGVNRLQNELLGDCLVREVECRCVIRTTLDEIPADNTEGAGSGRLVIYDCHPIGPEQILDIMHSSAWERLGSDYRTLLNLPVDSGMEKQALHLGARGFFYCGEGVEPLLRGIRSIFHNDLWVSRRYLVECIETDHPKMAPEPCLLSGLSRRESMVLRLLAEGLSNKELADRLCVSPYTVKAHLYRIFKKIQVGNRLQAIRWTERYLNPAQLH